jgi:hypothetical protein
MATKLTRLTDSQNSDTTAPSGRQLYHLQFSRQASSLETFGYAVVLSFLIQSIVWHMIFNLIGPYRQNATLLKRVSMNRIVKHLNNKLSTQNEMKQGDTSPPLIFNF